MRCFIAIDIDQITRKTLRDLQQQIASSIDVKKSDLKWVNPDNIHLTLKFLGEVKDQRIAQLCEIVKKVADEHKRFELDIESVGHFGGRSARVLWVGTGNGNNELGQLANDLEQQLASAGWPKEKREYNGHMTLCRIKNPKAGIKLGQISPDYKDFKVSTISVDSVIVYQSQLTPKGPIYTQLGSYKLQ